jgi:HEAT repeat protein
LVFLEFPVTQTTSLILFLAMVALFAALSYLIFSSLYGERSDIQGMVREHEQLVGQVDRERPETDKLLQELLVLEEKAAWMLSEKGKLIEELRDEKEKALFSEVYAGDMEMDESRVRELAALPVEELVRRFLDTIQESDKLTMALLGAALREKPDEAFQYLSSTFAGTDDKNLRFGYLYILSRLRDRRALPLFQKILADKSETDSLVLRAAASGLVALPDKSSVPVLISTLQNSADWGIKVNSATALGLIKDPRAIEPLKKEFAEAQNAIVRSFSLLALAHIADSQCAAFFSDIARTASEESHAIIAVQGLGRIDSQEAREALKEIASTDAGPAALEAQRALAVEKKEVPQDKRGSNRK